MTQIVRTGPFEYTTVGNIPPAPSSLGRGMETPVTDLKRRTIIQYPYTDEAKEGIWKTPTEYRLNEDPERDFTGKYKTQDAYANYYRRLVGARERPEIIIYEDPGYPAEEVMAHEYGHKYYYNEPGVAWRWTAGAPEREKEEAWVSYDSPERREEMTGTLRNKIDEVFIPWRTPREMESYARGAEYLFNEWAPEVREEQFGGLYDEEQIRKDKGDAFAIVNPDNVVIEERPPPLNKYGQTQEQDWFGERPPPFKQMEDPGWKKDPYPGEFVWRRE